MDANVIALHTAVDNLWDLRDDLAQALIDADAAAGWYRERETGAWVARNERAEAEAAAVAADLELVEEALALFGLSEPRPELPYANPTPPAVVKDVWLSEWLAAANGPAVATTEDCPF